LVKIILILIRGILKATLPLVHVFSSPFTLAQTVDVILKIYKFNDCLFEIFEII